MGINFYNPVSNLENTPEGGYEGIARYHFNEGNGVLNNIAKKHPELADQLGEYIAHMLLAINAYHHDIFDTKAPPAGEDFATKIRKNR